MSYAQSSLLLKPALFYQWTSLKSVKTVLVRNANFLKKITRVSQEVSAYNPLRPTGSLVPLLLSFKAPLRRNYCILPEDLNGRQGVCLGT